MSSDGRARTKPFCFLTSLCSDDDDAKTTNERKKERIMRDNKRGGGGGGGGQRRSKKARWFRPNDSGGTIPYGARGVIVTCDGGKERAAVRDVVRNLTERAEQTFGYEAAGTASGDAGEGKETTGDVVADALRAELEGLREEKKKPALKEMSLDLRACTFVGASDELANACDIVELVKADLERAKSTNVTFSRHCMRMIPVEVVCFAGVDEIKEAVKPLLERHFTSGKEQTFAISFERRANDSVRRTEVIEAIAGLIDQPPNKVNLSDPDLTIMVEIIKGVACLSVVPDYEKLCKYNLRMVAMSEEERKIAKSERHGNVVVTKPFADAEDDKEKEKKSEDAKKDDDE